MSLFRTCTETFEDSDETFIINWEIPNFPSSESPVFSERKNTDNFEFDMGLRFDEKATFCCARFFNFSSDIAESTNIFVSMSILSTWKRDSVVVDREFVPVEEVTDLGSQKEPFVIELPIEFTKEELCSETHHFLTRNKSLRLKIQVDVSVEWDSRKETGYIGLKNQGATCYMNSVLQSLYHIPAFRRIVYNMPTTGTEDVEKCIPLNLQRLFCLMQFSPSPVSTKALTKSFGWGDGDTIVEHDVEEFCRVLVDNLEKKLKGTEMQEDIAKLFRGKTRSYIRCLNVDYKSQREETFYDLQMVVKDCDSLQKSFEKFIERDRMDGDNQYMTPDFGKQDAEMGVEFLEFPLVLQIHLNRTEYDAARGRMVKLNNFFEFPRVIDLSPYMASDANKDDATYELFGVLVHKGGVGSGHYYCFLRPTSEKQWYRFDDDVVTQETKSSAVTDNFGGKSLKGKNKRYSGYMLVYVKQSEIQNVFQPVGDEDVPAHLREYARMEKERKEAKRSQKREAALSACVYVRDKTILTRSTLMGLHGFKSSESICSFRMERVSNVEDIYREVAKHMEVPVESIRIWKTNESHTPTNVLEVGTVGGIAERYAPYDVHVFVERKDPSEPVQPVHETVIYAKFFFPYAEAKIQFIDALHLSEDDTLGKTASILNDKLGFPSDTEMLAFLEVVGASPKHLDMSTSLKDNSLDSGSIVIFQLKPGTELESTFELQAPIRVETSEETDSEKLDESVPLVDADTIAPRDLTTVDLYLDSVERKVELNVYDYDDYAVPKFRFRFIATMFVEQVKDILAKAMHLDYDPSKSAIRLYTNTTGNAPGNVAIQPKRALTYMCGASRVYKSLFVQFIEGVGESEMESLAQYTVHLSTDGYQVAHTVKALARKRVTCGELTEVVKKRLKLDSLTGPYRWYFCYNGKSYRYGGTLGETSVIDYPYYIIRIDVVPEEQQTLGDNEYLLEVCFQTPRSGYGYYDRYSDPFFLIVREGETAAQFKQEVFAHLTETQHADMKDALCEVDSGKYPTARTLITDESIISEVAPSGSRVVFIVKKKPEQTIHVNQSVKIIN